MKSFYKNKNFKILVICFVFLIVFINIFYSKARNHKYPYKLAKTRRPLIGSEPSISNISLISVKNPTSDFPCFHTVTDPSFVVCIYSRLVDEFISRDLEDTGIWEPCISKVFQKILTLEPNCIVLDVGANIGYYTLWASKAGHYVISVEPVSKHLERLQTGIVVNGVKEKVAVLKNALADKRMKATVRRSGHNQGDSQIEMKSEECQGSCPATVDTILLNDLTYPISNLTYIIKSQPNKPFDINNLMKIILKNNSNGILSDINNVNKLQTSTTTSVVLKLDTQGFEHKIFTQADIFFNLNNVSYILMEWFNMKQIYRKLHKTNLKPQDETYNKKQPTLFDQILIEKMLNFLFGRGYTPYSTSKETFGNPLDPNHWSSWPHDILWVHLSRVQYLPTLFPTSIIDFVLQNDRCS